MELWAGRESGRKVLCEGERAADGGEISTREPFLTADKTGWARMRTKPVEAEEGALRGRKGRKRVCSGEISRRLARPAHFGWLASDAPIMNLAR